MNRAASLGVYMLLNSVFHNFFSAAFCVMLSALIRPT